MEIDTARIVRFLERKQEHTKLERMLEDLRFGKVLALIAQIFAKDPTKSTPYEPRDFFPELPAAQKQEQTWQEQLEVMKANSAILGRLR